jgi:uncharacterized repeat protein (TIGR01451 family)
MGRDESHRALFRSLAWLAAAFAVIFTLNGIGFSLRSAHVDAGGKDRGQQSAAKDHMTPQAKEELLARGLKLGDPFVESTPTASADKGGGHGLALGHADAHAAGRPSTHGGEGSEKALGAAGSAQRDARASERSDEKGSDKQDTEPGSNAPVESASESVVAPEPDQPPAANETVVTLGGPAIVLPPECEPATEPVIVPGNPPLCEGGYKIESPSFGTHVYHVNVGGHEVSITVVVYWTDRGQAFNWTSSWPIEQVVVKGGSLGANVYAYDPPATSDCGLHAPQANEKNAHWAGLSYIAFCFGEKPPAEVTKTFVMTYPDLSEGASLWVTYEIGDAPAERLQLMPTGDDTYSAVVEHIAAGSIIKGEWQISFGEHAETLGTFCEVLTEDKTNTFSHVPQVCGTKYEDLNGNGMRDEGEPGIAGWTIQLMRKAWLVCDVGTWEPFAQVLTDADGDYCFAGLPPGLYKVAEEERTGWKQTDAPETSEFFVCGDTNLTGLDFGNLELPDITVLKFEDVNGNGVRDEMTGGGLEPALSGWTFTLMSGGEAIDEATTGEDGTVTFADLDLGTYRVDETVQEGWQTTTALPLSVDLDTSGSDVSLAVGNRRIPTTSEVDLAILKASNPATVAPGGMVTYRLTYYNLGETPAVNFTIVDDYDEGLVAEVVDAGGGVVDTEDGTMTWTFAGPLEKEEGPQSVVYTVRIRDDIDEDTFVDNVAVIDVADDVDLSNNRAEARVEVVVEPFLPFVPGEEEEGPSLPFTGGDLLVLVSLAGLSTAGGLALRRIGREKPADQAA